MHCKRTPDILRRRHGFACLFPRYRDGLWLQVTWLWWSWDYLQKPIVERVGNMLDEMNGGADRAGPPTVRAQDGGR